ncbi:MAG: DUF1501 domain-containing protein [Bryobacterales bacterium]|nr:DUF1501 domain-containing protein [Bryobacterales bacterium]
MQLQRRAFLRTGAAGLGSIALQSLLAADDGTPGAPHFSAKAKHIIFLHMLGGPSQVDLLDPKPMLAEFEGKPLPDSILKGKQFAFVPKGAGALASPYEFNQHGESGTWFSELIPHLADQADDLTVVRSMQTDEFNHGAGELFLHTGFGRLGRPTFGSWVSYGLGSLGDSLPTFVVLATGANTAGNSAWGSGFLPSIHQGVKFRSGAEPVHYLANPEGISRDRQARVVDGVSALNRLAYERYQDPEIATRIAQYEMAFRLQASGPELMQLENEPQHVLEAYGAKPGGASYANMCLLARRMVERGVRFVQIMMAGWDHHSAIYGPNGLPRSCRIMDRPTAALIDDLKQRGLLDDTLVIWTGEFGRTPMAQAISPQGFTQDPGRDHHKDGFSLILAGGGTRPGLTHGATDDFGFEPAEDPVHVHDLHATALHLLGIDHTKLTFKHQGRDFRLTDVHGRVIDQLLA